MIIVLLHIFISSIPNSFELTHKKNKCAVFNQLNVDIYTRNIAAYKFRIVILQFTRIV